MLYEQHRPRKHKYVMRYLDNRLGIDNRIFKNIIRVNTREAEREAEREREREREWEREGEGEGGRQMQREKREGGEGERGSTEAARSVYCN